MAGKHDTNAQHKESVGFLLLALLILALVAGLAVFGVWYWQQQEVNRLNERIDQLGQQQTGETTRLNDRIVQLDKELAAAKAAAEKPPAEEPMEPAATNKYTSPKGVTLEVDTPAKGVKVSSPLKVSGQVPGNWSFEASFAVLLKDSAGNTLASVPAQLLGDWMTTDLVPFEATLTFTSPGSGSGQLVLLKNNPSALPDKDDSVIIPVSF